MHGPGSLQVSADQRSLVVIKLHVKKIAYDQAPPNFAMAGLRLVPAMPRLRVLVLPCTPRCAL